MSLQSERLSEEWGDYTNIFVHLLFGIQVYVQKQQLDIPHSLRRALNAISLAEGEGFPKTLARFIDRCHQPLADWYPLPIPDEFTSSQPLLDDGELSDNALLFCMELVEQLELSPDRYNLPQIALDNREMVELIKTLRDSPNAAEAQQMYVNVRSFLIEHSCTTPDELQAYPPATFQALRRFYEPVPKHWPDPIVVCNRCGLLEWRDQRWQGVRPDYCSDHGSHSSRIYTIPHSRQLHRLTRGIHLRAFLPGQLERALFDFADHARAQYPEYLTSVERYPGLDTYDLRLTFSNNEIWAVDAKDHASPERLAPRIVPPYGEGSLQYTQAFYVIPDERMDEFDYFDRLEHAVGPMPPRVLVVSASVFQQRVEEKLRTLAVPPRSKKAKKG